MGLVKPRSSAAPNVSAEKANGGEVGGKGKPGAQVAQALKRGAESTATGGTLDEAPERREAPSGAQADSSAPEDK